MAKALKNLGKYVDFKTDFGMKLYFGKENKPILIAFLNDLFAGEKIIEDLAYLETEHDGELEGDRRVIFDLHCRGLDGEFFIIEMQQLRQDFFRDRSVYYTSRLISKQVKKGKQGNDYQLPEVYFIALLEFCFDDQFSTKYLYDVVLCDKHTHEVFYNKLGYKFLVLPTFVKKESELVSNMDQWFYLLKHISNMKQISKVFDKRIFSLIFKVGEVAKLDENKLMKYEASLKHRRDAEAVHNSSRRAGIAEGLTEGLAEGMIRGKKEGIAMGKKEGLIEMAVKMKKSGFENKLIVDITGLPIEEIEKL